MGALRTCCDEPTDTPTPIQQPTIIGGFQLFYEDVIFIFAVEDSDQLHQTYLEI